MLNDLGIDRGSHHRRCRFVAYAEKRPCIQAPTQQECESQANVFESEGSPCFDVLLPAIGVERQGNFAVVRRMLEFSLRIYTVQECEPIHHGLMERMVS